MFCEQDHYDSKQLLGDNLADNIKKAKVKHYMKQSISNKRLRLSSIQLSKESNNPLLEQLKAQLFKLQMPQDKLPVSAAHHKGKSEAAASNEGKLDIILFGNQTLSNKKVKTVAGRSY